MQLVSIACGMGVPPVPIGAGKMRPPQELKLTATKLHNRVNLELIGSQ
ncbi:MAG: hypothetical protein HC865_15915 [Cyanobacteria bacterium RU_5_0]|nr:hypothetical protein [Cyanobacteria bacterium RU_5_0]